jgi:hypothetical protein
MNFNFNSRDTYLAQVADWKALYAEHSQQIRDTRRAFRQAQSDDSKGKGNWATTERLRSELASLRDEATSLIDDRHAAKAEAGRQWEAQRQAA